MKFFIKICCSLRFLYREHLVKEGLKENQGVKETLEHRVQGEFQGKWDQKVKEGNVECVGPQDQLGLQVKEAYRAREVYLEQMDQEALKV